MKMIKKIEFNILLLLFSALVSASNIYSDNAPNWVNSIRTGNITLKVKSGNKILFRSNVPANDDLTSSELCDLAVKKNIEYIHKAYPNIENIPMTTEMIFYDTKVKDCSTTISVSNSVEELNRINDKKRQDLEKKLNNAKDEKIALQNQIMNLQAELRKLDKINENENENADVMYNNYKAFYSEGLPKTNNRKYRLEYPKHWLSKNGIRPHIVKKFMSPPNEPLSMCLVYQSQSEEELPAEDMEYIINNHLDTFMQGSSFKGMKILRAKPAKIEGKPAVIYDSIMGMSRGEYKLIGKMHNAIIYDGKDIFMLQCSSNGKDEYILREFRHFINSFVLLDQY